MVSLVIMYQHHLCQYHTANLSGSPPGLVELHSTASFYTSNPLLYVSHYSEIIVHTGACPPAAPPHASACPATGGVKDRSPAVSPSIVPRASFCGPPAKSMAAEAGTGWNLTHQRQLVEQLDAEHLLDYLHRNGVLSEAGKLLLNMLDVLTLL